MKRKADIVMLSFLTVFGFVGATARAQSPGSVFAIANTANGEMSISAAFDGTNYLVGIQGDATAHYNITAQLVSPTGTLVGSRISIGRTGGVPWVAFDGINYLMVWADDALSPVDRLYGVFVRPSGTLVGSPFAFPVRAGASSRQEPWGIAFDGTNYLVIYMDGDPTGEDPEPLPYYWCGRFVSTAGAVGDEFVLASNARGTIQAVAWNGTTYLVAWPAHSGGNQSIVQGRTVSKTGAMSDLITIDGTFSVDQNPLSVATDGTNFLVVWNYDASVDDQGDAIWELRGRVVTPVGGFLGSQFTVADTSTRPFFPAVAFDGANYLVAWTAHHDSENLDIAGRYFGSNGTPLGAAFGIAVGNGNQGLSPVVFGGGKYLVVWNDGFAFESGGGITGGDVLGALIPPIVITLQPETQTVTAGGSATFTLAASRNPAPGYQWQVSTDGGFTWTDLTNNAPYSGVTTATLTVSGTTTALSRYQFRCVLSNSVGSVNSDAAMLRVAPTTLRFSGSDDFSTTAHWSAPTRIMSGGSRLNFANSRLEHVASAPSDEGAALREWTANVGSYTQDWSVQVNVHLASLSLSDEQYANLNLVVVNAAEATNSIGQMDRMSVNIHRDSATRFQTDVTAYYAGTSHDSGHLGGHETYSTTDASLRITFNSATKELSSWYDADGATGGDNWTLVHSVNIGSGTYMWDMTDSGTFVVALVGASRGAAVSSGQAYFDNFQATTTTTGVLLHDWNGDEIVSIIGDVPPFVQCVYFNTCPSGVDSIAIGDCNHDGILSIIGDVPCFVQCVYFQNCPR